MGRKSYDLYGVEPLDSLILAYQEDEEWGPKHDAALALYKAAPQMLEMLKRMFQSFGDIHAVRPRADEVRDLIDDATGLHLAVLNRKQELWLMDISTENCFFIPQGWCDEWSVATGHAGGLDNVDDDGKPEPEIYCYYPTQTVANSEVETGFVAIKDLEQLVPTTEEEARKRHPKLGKHLDAIDAEDGMIWRTKVEQPEG
jgi:hypothetical protein